MCVLSGELNESQNNDNSANSAIGFVAVGSVQICPLGHSRGLFLHLGVGIEIPFFPFFLRLGGYLWNLVKDLVPPLWGYIYLLLQAGTCIGATLILHLALIVSMTFVLSYASL